MKFKNYFNNLEKYWSANFLALLSSTFLVSFTIWVFVNLVSLAFQATSFSEFLELVSNSFSFGPIYPIVFFPLSCLLSAYFSIFYILVIISKKKWCILVCTLSIIIIWCYFFTKYQELLKFENGAGDLIFFYFFPASIIALLISMGLYIILLLLELIPKFRTPQSILSKNIIFKKYIKVSYWLYLLLICDIICILIYPIVHSGIPRY